MFALSTVCISKPCNTTYIPVFKEYIQTNNRIVKMKKQDLTDPSSMCRSFYEHYEGYSFQSASFCMFLKEILACN